MSMEKGMIALPLQARRRLSWRAGPLSFHQLCRRMISVCISTFII